MADSDPYSDLSDLVASIMNLALPGNDSVDQSEPPAVEPPALEPPALEPIPGLCQEEEESPQHQEWTAEERAEIAEEWRQRREARYRRTFRLIPSRPHLLTVPDYYEWFPPLQSLIPLTIKVSRATQTMAIAIPRIPVESHSFPVPWARRLRTTSVATQTDESMWTQYSPGGLSRHRPAEPEWDPLPGEIFSLDEITSQPLDDSYEDTSLSSSSSLHSSNIEETHGASSLLTTAFHDTSLYGSSFLQTIFGASPQDTSLIDIPFQAFPATGWPTTLPQRDDDEVVIYSTLERRRTVATNTFHIGWRRPRREPAERLRSRTLSLGWRSDAVTTDVTTQTEF